MDSFHNTSGESDLEICVRQAQTADLDAVLAIYNEGIEDRIATLDQALKTLQDIEQWWTEHDSQRYMVLVGLHADRVVGWASLNHFSHRCAHDAIADLSIYVSREYRGRGVGTALLDCVEQCARESGFHKIVLHALNDNELGKQLYHKLGYTDVGIFREHGALEGRYVDVIAMEKILR